MDFSKLRHRVIFLKPLDKRLNSMNENVPVWIPFKPKLSGDINAAETSVYVLTDNKGNAVWKSAGGGQLYSHQLSLNEYAVWANVSPMSGREYEESKTACRNHIQNYNKVFSEYNRGYENYVRAKGS